MKKIVYGTANRLFSSLYDLSFLQSKTGKKRRPPLGKITLSRGRSPFRIAQEYTFRHKKEGQNIYRLNAYFCLINVEILKMAIFLPIMNIHRANTPTPKRAATILLQSAFPLLSVGVGGLRDVMPS